MSRAYAKVAFVMEEPLELIKFIPPQSEEEDSERLVKEIF